MCKCIPIVQSIYHNIYTYVHVFTCMQNLIAPARTSHTGDALWHTMIYVAASNQSPALVFLRWSSSPDLNCFQMWNVRDDPVLWISVGGMGCPLCRSWTRPSSPHRLPLLYSCFKLPTLPSNSTMFTHCFHTGTTSLDLSDPICWRIRA